jgi:GNAT superfamily N-acetyltransferase
MSDTPSSSRILGDTLIVDSFGTRYAVERKMHREMVIYYVLALDPNGDLAARARTSKDLLAGVPAFIARAVLSLKRDRINEVMVWPDHRRRGIASALYRLIEADLGRPLRPSRMRSEVGQAFWKARKEAAAASSREKSPAA